MPPFARAWTRSIPGRCRSWASAGACSSSNSIGRRSARCRRHGTSWRRGSRVASTSTITSRSTTTGTACRISSCMSASRRASRATTVEVFLNGRRVASHARLTGRGRYVTDVAHMPRAHRAHAEWTPSRLIALGRTDRSRHGTARRRHPRTTAASGARLSRVPRAHAPRPRSTGWTGSTPPVARAERLRSYSYRTVEHILIHQQDRLPLDESAPARPGAHAREPAWRDVLRGGLC